MRKGLNGAISGKPGKTLFSGTMPKVQPNRTLNPLKTARPAAALAMRPGASEICAVLISPFDRCFAQRGLRGALGLQQGGVRLLQHGAQLESLTSFRAG